jgi:uncharacterized protein
MSVGPELRRLALQEAEFIRESVSGVLAVVLATIDGFDVASAVAPGQDPARIAALASSIAAMGAVVSQEAGLGRHRSVTVNTDGGFACISTVHRPNAELVLMVIANASAILAQVNYRSARAAKELERM